MIFVLKLLEYLRCEYGLCLHVQHRWANSAIDTHLDFELIGGNWLHFNY